MAKPHHPAALLTTPNQLNAINTVPTAQRYQAILFRFIIFDFPPAQMQQNAGHADWLRYVPILDRGDFATVRTDKATT
jgi:hypothetical protein